MCATRSRAAPAGRPAEPRHTARSGRRRSRPVTSTSTSRPAARSSPTDRSAEHRRGRAGQHGGPDGRGGGQRQRGRGLGRARPQRAGQRRGQYLPGARALLPADQRRGGQLGRGDGAAAGPRMPGRHDQHQPVVPDGLAAQRPRHVRSLDEPEVRPAVADPGQHRVAVGGGEHDLGGRLARPPGRRGAEGHQAAGQQRLGHREAGADPEPAVPVLAQRGDPGVQLGGHVEQPGRPLGHHHALVRQAGPARRPADQRHAGLGLNGPDARGDRLLADAQLAGGAVQAARPGHGEQHLQRREVGHMSAEPHAPRLPQLQARACKAARTAQLPAAAATWHRRGHDDNRGPAPPRP